MINDKLLNKLNRIENLPISEEMLGAYLEGRVNSTESSLIENCIESNNFISSILYDTNTSQFNLNNLDNEFENEVIDFEEVNLFIDKYNSEINNDMENLNRAYSTYGEFSENIKDPVYIQQPDDHSCALRSQQIVLRDFGIDIPFDKLEQLAKEYGVYTDEGTFTYDIGKVLQIAGVGVHQVEGSTMMDLTNELALGHRVIVSVDASELWYNDTTTDKLKNWFNDAIGNQGGNHALIVAGVQVNPDDPNDVQVVLTDPGAGDLRVEYPIDQFMDAWKDSNCFMAATDNAAPYQYDANTGMEIPSNFVVQQYINDFIASNGYQLNPDMINIPQDYQPVFAGHLDMVGSINYDAFESSYNGMLENRIPSSLSIKEQIEEFAKDDLHNSLNGETTVSVNNNSLEYTDSEDGSDDKEEGYVGDNFYESQEICDKIDIPERDEEDNPNSEDYENNPDSEDNEPSEDDNYFNGEDEE